MRFPPNDTLLTEIRTQAWCEVCEKPRKKIDVAHLFTVGMGGNGISIRQNLLGACRPCHSESHSKLWGEYDPNFLRIIAEREREHPEDIVAVMRLFRNRLVGYCTQSEIVRGLATLETDAQRRLAMKVLEENGYLS